jgi:DNA helicase-2/ATP-dependent DNA helicase PcrA
MMMDNYRSTPQIISAVNSLIGKNQYRMKKDLVPTLPDGGKVVCHHAANSEAEAAWIAAKMSRNAWRAESHTGT